MRRRTAFGAVAGVFALTISCNEIGQQQLFQDQSVQGKAAIERSLGDISKALTDFPRTRDKKSVLRFLHKDYVGIRDGEAETIKDLDKYFSGILEQINLGDPIGISYKISNMSVHASGAVGWATYDDEYKLGRGGVVLEEHRGKCTDIYVKEGVEWRIKHEHCSTPNRLGRLR